MPGTGRTPEVTSLRAWTTLSRRGHHEPSLLDTAQHQGQQGVRACGKLRWGRGCFLVSARRPPMDEAGSTPRSGSGFPESAGSVTSWVWAASPRGLAGLRGRWTVHPGFPRGGGRLALGITCRQAPPAASPKTTPLGAPGFHSRPLLPPEECWSAFEGAPAHPRGFKKGKVGESGRTLEVGAACGAGGPSGEASELRAPARAPQMAWGETLGDPVLLPAGHPET